MSRSWSFRRSQMWHSRIDLEQQLKHIESPEMRRSISAVIRHAHARGLDKDDNFPHLVTADEPKIADKPPTIFHITPKTVGAQQDRLRPWVRSFTARPSRPTEPFYSTAIE